MTLDDFSKRVEVAHATTYDDLTDQFVDKVRATYTALAQAQFTISREVHNRIGQAALDDMRSRAEHEAVCLLWNGVREEVGAPTADADRYDEARKTALEMVETVGKVSLMCRNVINSDSVIAFINALNTLGVIDYDDRVDAISRYMHMPYA